MSLTTERVWDAVEDSVFGVLAFVNRHGHPRTTGVCFTVEGRSLYVSTARDSWKVRHIAANPNVSGQPSRFQSSAPEQMRFAGSCSANVNNAMPICRQEKPAVKEHDNGHFVACHLYD